MKIVRCRIMNIHATPFFEDVHSINLPKLNQRLYPARQGDVPSGDVERYFSMDGVLAEAELACPPASGCHRSHYMSFLNAKIPIAISFLLYV